MAMRGRHRRQTDSRPLLAQAAENPTAFDELYLRYSQRVLVFLTARVLDAEVALDLTADTFVVVLEQAHSFRGTTDMEQEAWLLRLARTRVSRYFRRGAVERSALGRVGVVTPAMSTWEIERVEELAGVPALAASLAHALGTLPEEQREAVRLRAVEECDYASIAAQQFVSEQVARARVSRGLRKLATLLESVHDEEVA